MKIMIQHSQCNPLIIIIIIIFQIDDVNKTHDRQYVFDG